MMKTLQLILLLLAQSVYGSTVAVYFENYAQYRPATPNRPVFTVDRIDPQLITDLYYAFAYFGVITASVDPKNAGLTGNFLITPTEPNDQSELYPALFALKQKAPHLRLFLTIGGWNFNAPNAPTKALFSRMISKASYRKEFINSCIDYAHRFHFDGIDIDWEYPGDLTRGGSPDDFKNFQEFLKECRTSFKAATPSLGLSCAFPAHVPAGLSDEVQKNPDLFYRFIADCAKNLDRIAIMAYDYHTPDDGSLITGVNAPLLRDTSPKSPYYIQKTLALYLNNGVPKEKILLGIPTFGHSYADVLDLQTNDTGAGKPFKKSGAKGPSTQIPGLLAYYEIADMIKDTMLLLYDDDVTSTVYGVDSASKTWVSFDSPKTTALKAKLALTHQLQGVIFWAIDMDEYAGSDPFPNIKSALQVLGSTTSTPNLQKD